MKKILFVCTGNTCRSPMAEIILKSKIKLAGLKGIRVSSAGIDAEEGHKISKNSFEALKLLGYKAYGFKAKRLTVEMLNNADVIITMSESHKKYLSGYSNVYTMKEITGKTDVPDPYGGDLTVYIKTSHVLEDACNNILEQILDDKGE